MGAADQIRATEAEERGACPECGRTLLHHWGRHQGLWCVFHPQAICSLADCATDRFASADEARDAFLARRFLAKPAVISADELVRLRETWLTPPKPATPPRRSRGQPAADVS